MHVAIYAILDIYKYIGHSTNKSISEQMITVQERGNSIYRESTYSGNLSFYGRQSFNRGLGLFGRQSFGRGTETFKRYQHAQQNALNKDQDQPLKEPSQSSSETIELQSLQQQESPVVEQEQTMDQVEIHQVPVDDNTD